MQIEDVLNCSFSSWYPTFKDVTIPSEVIPIPAEFLQYLNTDGVVLPGSLRTSLENELTSEIRIFGEFESKIRDSIGTLGGKVFPKLNWSAPKDAAWLSFDSSLACVCPGDVYLLLKSSDFITHDLTQPFSHCEDLPSDERERTAVSYELVLRAWRDLSPSCEFRCFVRKRVLTGICQRHTRSYFEELADSEHSIVDSIQSFTYEVVGEKFPNTSCVLDVYCAGPDGRVTLIDVGPFGPVTDSLLFTWDELFTDAPLTGTNDSRSSIEDRRVSRPAFRYVDREAGGVMPSPYSHYGYPLDARGLVASLDPNKLVDLTKLEIQTQGDSDDVSGDEIG